jgi:hypothetical protein
MKIIACLIIIACILSFCTTITTAEFSNSLYDPYLVNKPEINEPIKSLEGIPLKVLAISAATCASVSSTLISSAAQN